MTISTALAWLLLWPILAPWWALRRLWAMTPAPYTPEPPRPLPVPDERDRDWLAHHAALAGGNLDQWTQTWTDGTSGCA